MIPNNISSTSDFLSREDKQFYNKENLTHLIERNRTLANARIEKRLENNFPLVGDAINSTERIAKISKRKGNLIEYQTSTNASFFLNEDGMANMSGSLNYLTIALLEPKNASNQEFWFPSNNKLIAGNAIYITAPTKNWNTIENPGIEIQDLDPKKDYTLQKILVETPQGDIKINNKLYAYKVLWEMDLSKKRVSLSCTPAKYVPVELCKQIIW